MLDIAGIDFTSEILFHINVLLYGLILILIILFLEWLLKRVKKTKNTGLIRDSVFIIGLFFIYVYGLIGSGYFRIDKISHIFYWGPTIKTIFYIVAFGLSIFIRKFTGHDRKGIILGYIVSIVILFFLNCLFVLAM